jgi:hypothetical protein
MQKVAAMKRNHGRPARASTGVPSRRKTIVMNVNRGWWLRMVLEYCQGKDGVAAVIRNQPGAWWSTGYGLATCAAWYYQGGTKSA